jgi:hypothetical protein
LVKSKAVAPQAECLAKIRAQIFEKGVRFCLNRHPPGEAEWFPLRRLMKDFSISKKGNKSATIVILIILILAICIFFIPSKIFQPSWDFRNNLWAPSYLLVNHMSPYNIKVVFEFSNAVWMPMIIGLFFPLGYLPLQWASNIWLLINLASLFLIIFVIAKTPRESGILILLILFSLLIFPSTVTNFTLGQVSLEICLALLILTKYRNNLKPIVIGLLISITLTKPQLVVLFLPTYLIMSFREQGVKYSSKIIIYILIWTAVLCAPLFIFFPNWIPDFLSNLATNNTWFYPTLYAFLVSNFGLRTMTLSLAGIYLVIGLMVSIFLSIKLDKFEALLWVLAITPLFSPIVWSWDFVLLYPLMIFMVLEKKSVVSSRITYSGYVICTIIFIVMRSTGHISEHFTFWIPVFLISVLLLSRISKNFGQVSKVTPKVSNKPYNY